MVRRCWIWCVVAAVAVGTGCATVQRPADFREPELVFVKGGCFQMGNTFGDLGQSEETPVHEVCVGDFYMGKTEVTQGEWKVVVGTAPPPAANPLPTNPTCGDRCPVEGVSWNDAQTFVARLNRITSGGYRLPTEAEWEYAARSGGKPERHSGRNDGNLDAIAWFLPNSQGENEQAMTHAVASKAPNGLGLYDMSGNVAEWTADWYGATYYATSPRDNPTGPAKGERRVLRGGGYPDEGWDLRTTARNALPPDHRGRGKGLRILKTP